MNEGKAHFCIQMYHGLLTAENKSWSFRDDGIRWNFSRADSRVRMWVFDVSGTMSFPIFRVSWWFGKTKTDDFVSSSALCISPSGRSRGRGVAFHLATGRTGLYIHIAELNSSLQFWCYQITSTPWRWGLSSRKVGKPSHLDVRENFLELKTSSFFDQSDLLIPVAAVRILRTVLLYKFGTCCASFINTALYDIVQACSLLYIFFHHVIEVWPPLWSSGQSFWLQIQRSRVWFPALPDFSE